MPCHVTSYHVISYYIISYHIISYHIISYHIISYHIISYHIISIISHHIISYHIISSSYANLLFSSLPSPKLLGSLLKEQGQLDEALAHYLEAVTIDPLFSDGYRYVTIIHRTTFPCIFQILVTPSYTHSLTHSLCTLV